MDDVTRPTTCGSAVRVVGKTTQHFEPIDMENRIEEARREAFALGRTYGERIGSLKQRISEREFTVSVPSEHHAIKQLAREVIEEHKKALAELEKEASWFIAGGSDGIACREYIGPHGEGVMETDDAHKVARAVLDAPEDNHGKEWALPDMRVCG